MTISPTRISRFQMIIKIFSGIQKKKKKKKKKNLFST